MVPFSFAVSKSELQGVAGQYGTPLWLYDRSSIESRYSELSYFDAVRYAQKANCNLAILALLRKLGAVVDAVSAGEIVRALRAGYIGGGKVPGIVFTADVIDDDALQLIREHKLTVNVGSPDMIVQLAAANIKTDLVLRINPGFGHGHSRKTNTGGDLSKHGVWHEQVEDCLRLAHNHGLSMVGAHMHIGSGSDFAHLSQVCSAMVREASRFGSQLHTISAGGGLPIPYRKDNTERIDVKRYYHLWDQARKEIEKVVGHGISLEVEPGRYLVAESGILLARVRAVKTMGTNTFILVDAGFTDLVRPAFYGSYHYISVIAADGSERTEVSAVVGGPLCESGDVFTQEEGGFVVTRLLPRAMPGDLLVIHDAGAYGAAMSSNYNTRPLAGEFLWTEGRALEIRKRQSFEHLLANDIIPAEFQ